MTELPLHSLAVLLCESSQHISSRRTNGRFRTWPELALPAPTDRGAKMRTKGSSPFREIQIFIFKILLEYHLSELM